MATKTGYNAIKNFMNGRKEVQLNRSVREENEMQIKYYKSIDYAVPQVIREDKKEGYTIEFDFCRGENGYWDENCYNINMIVVPIKRFTNKEINQILDIAINGIEPQ